MDKKDFPKLLSTNFHSFLSGFFPPRLYDSVLFGSLLVYDDFTGVSATEKRDGRERDRHGRRTGRGSQSDRGSGGKHRRGFLHVYKKTHGQGKDPRGRGTRLPPLRGRSFRKRRAGDRQNGRRRRLHRSFLHALHVHVVEGRTLGVRRVGDDHGEPSSL